MGQLTSGCYIGLCYTLLKTNFVILQTKFVVQLNLICSFLFNNRSHISDLVDVKQYMQQGQITGGCSSTPAVVEGLISDNMTSEVRLNISEQMSA